jgi:hypothetical protein
LKLSFTFLAKILFINSFFFSSYIYLNVALSVPIFPLWKRGMKGDFKINEFIKSPLTPLCQRGVFAEQ